jgi:predicted RNA-binding Zn-ribbon protein involved in translation (DUF1610 family)
MNDLARPKDLPRDELMVSAEAAILSAPLGSYVHFKFTCENCGERCVLAEANTLWQKGECFACGYETPIAAGGYMLIMPTGVPRGPVH